jgi:phenylalanyl-tRNA synthetase alpha chain
MNQVAELHQQALTEVQAATSSAELKEIRSRFLGEKGQISGLRRLIGAQAPEDRKAFGQSVNQAYADVEQAIERRLSDLRASEQIVQFEAESLDVTMPGDPQRLPVQHVLTQISAKIKRVLGGMGFVYVEGPELEDFAYNFDALNYPEDHPAMDEQDTFYISDRLVLRTQCTALQGRIFERQSPPLRCFTIGRTFRNEAVDRTHSHTFHQVDCFMVDEGVSMAQLKGTLSVFARAMFGSDVQVRFRPDFFPFVEPGVDYAISSPKLFGGRWVELGGAGLIHPSILEAHGIDSERYTGFAFGLGVERIPMMAYGVDDLRLFLENDLRFLEQFRFEPVA